MQSNDNESSAPRQPEKLVGEDPSTPGTTRKEEAVAVAVCRLVQRILLLLVGLMTLGAAAVELVAIYESRSIDLADILLMFLYSEVIAMVAAYFSGRGSHLIYPIFIAITALARLIVLQGKEMAPENIVYEAVAILLLALAAVVVTRAIKS